MLVSTVMCSIVCISTVSFVSIVITIVFLYACYDIYVYVCLYYCDGFCGQEDVLCEFVFVMDGCFKCSNKLLKVCVMGASISMLLLVDLLWGAYDCL